jgi:DNA-binding NarL/FixJ family response regulator
MEVVGQPSVTVLVVDDQPPFRRAARSVVGLTPGFEMVGEAESGEEALQQVEALAPDLVLMDIQLPGMNGVEAARHVIAAHPEITVLLLSTYAADDVLGAARSFGAAYVKKEEFGPQALKDTWERRSTRT